MGPDFYTDINRFVHLYPYLVRLDGRDAEKQILNLILSYSRKKLTFKISQLMAPNEQCLLCRELVCIALSLNSPVASTSI
jgi:hypothetical protein